jgi:hypothetical protein
MKGFQFIPSCTGNIAVSCSIYPDKKCLIVINEATDDVCASIDPEKCISPESIEKREGNGFHSEMNMMTENEIDTKRRFIDESYYDDEIDIEGKENVLLTENEQNRGENDRNNFQIQVMQQNCPYLWKTNDSLIGIGKKLIRIDKDRNRLRDKTKMNRNYNKSVRPSHTPSSSTSSVTSVLKYERDNLQLLKSTLQNKSNKRDSSFSLSSAYDSDDILSSLGGDFDISDYDVDKRGNYNYIHIC